MELVIHRVNTIAKLRQLPTTLGVELDVRSRGSQLILQHEPFENGDRLADYLDAYAHGLLVVNIKEAGLEDETLRLVRSAGLQRFFLLDVEFPYLYRASRSGERAIAVRFSEEEPLEMVQRFRPWVDWVWIDTFTQLPLDEMSVSTLRQFHTCVVCPERWGRPHDIRFYVDQMRRLQFEPSAVMTSENCATEWRALS